MPRILEAKQKWTFSGDTVACAGKAYHIGPEASAFSIYYTSSSGCTATVNLQSCAGSSAGPWAVLGSSQNMSTGETYVHQFSGPLEWVRPYLTAIAKSTDVVTVTLIGI